MNVILFDPPLRWHVTSEHGHDPYLVDLGEHGGHGQCDCRHFQCKLGPKVNEGSRGDAVMCKHMRAARRHLADLVVQRFLEDDKVRKKIKLCYGNQNEKATESGVEDKADCLTGIPKGKAEISEEEQDLCGM